MLGKALVVVCIAPILAARLHDLYCASGTTVIKSLSSNAPHSGQEHYKWHQPDLLAQNPTISRRCSLCATTEQPKFKKGHSLDQGYLSLHWPNILALVPRQKLTGS
ncbi:hypothetical protein CLF_109453 [Clonorchis sinensis]|uniref:Secreted protein n=1 Tax=Clonorchis sinensis TaxID=79923 RepID=G7YSM5_CLOSI|nr:hypothetical protein CLF_109453 [Clonorchis sinensis]